MSIDVSDEDVPVQGSRTEARSAAPVGRSTRQAVRKVVESKALEAEKGKRKKRGATKPQAPYVATASPAEASFGAVSDDSESPSPAVKKKKDELLETTVADMEKLKERLKPEIREGQQKEPILPSPAPLRSKFGAKKSTLLEWLLRRLLLKVCLYTASLYLYAAPTEQEGGD